MLCAAAWLNINIQASATNYQPHHSISPPPLPSFPPPISSLPKVNSASAPYSHQLTPPAPPSSTFPTSFGSKPWISVCSALPPHPSFLHSTQCLPYPAHGYSLAGPIAMCCPVINESFHTQGLSWLLGWWGAVGTEEFLMSVCRVNATWDEDGEEGGER